MAFTTLIQEAFFCPINYAYHKSIAQLFVDMPIIVTAALIEQNGKWLIARRKADRKMGGYWEFPGGKLEANETPEQCLQRELREELCIETAIGDVLAAADFEFQGTVYHIVAYGVVHISGKIVLTDHDALVWVTPADLRHYRLTPADRDIVEQLWGKE